MIRLSITRRLYPPPTLLGRAPSDIANELRVMDYVTFESGTDPGDDVTMYLIESTGGLKGYLILSDSFHADPRKAAFIDALLSKRHVFG